jgi:hypothetical protein
MIGRATLAFAAACGLAIGSSSARAQDPPPAAGGADVDAAAASDDGFWDRFKDPVDGRFDITASGGGDSGLLPLVIPFNDPAIGAGAVAGVVYFHPDEEGAGAPEGAGSGPPTMSFAGAARSDNDTWVAAGGHAAVLRDGRLRYLGIVGTASVNLDFYGIGDDPVLSENPLSFSLDGDLLLQQAQFQLGESRLAVGFRLTYLEANTVFDLAPGAEVDAGRTNDAGLGIFASRDTRDTTFTPSSGGAVRGALSMFSESLGGDFDYAKFAVSSRTYLPLRDSRLILGLRADYDYVGGDAPFYALNWVSLRGVPAFRYLGNHAAVFEVEPRWKIDERWSVVGFAGFGRAATDASDLDDAEGAYNYGFGFRYLLARSLGLGAGIDLARGPEESVIMLTLGTAWGL